MSTTPSLTTLPPEIRSTIFEHALAPNRSSDIRTVAGLNLLGTSKQIYNETRLVPFQTNTVSLASITDSSTDVTLKLLERLSNRQLNAVRKLDLQVVGSTLDAAAGTKVLRLMRLANDQWDLNLDSSAHFLPAYEGDLQELVLTISSRDIAIPLADCRTGLHQLLDVEHSTLLAWIATFNKLRKLRMRVRVLNDDQFPEEMREQLRGALQKRMPTSAQLRIDFEVVTSLDCFVDELELIYPDSYIGLWGNICPVPQEYQPLFKWVAIIYLWSMADIW